MNRRFGIRVFALSLFVALVMALLVLGLPVTARPAQAPEEELVEMEVMDVVPMDEGEAHAVILVSKGEGTVLPVFVEESAAVAIAFRLAHRDAPHALVEDLLDRMVGELGGTVEQVRIGAIQNHLDLSTITVRQGEKVFRVPARASDSISMALTSGAKIFATAELVKEVGITQKEIEELRDKMGVGGSGEGDETTEEAPPAKEGSGLSL